MRAIHRLFLATALITSPHGHGGTGCGPGAVIVTNPVLGPLPVYAGSINSTFNFEDESACLGFEGNAALGIRLATRSLLCFHLAKGMPENSIDLVALLPSGLASSMEVTQSQVKDW